MALSSLFNDVSKPPSYWSNINIQEDLEFKILDNKEGTIKKDNIKINKLGSNEPTPWILNKKTGKALQVQLEPMVC